MTHASLQLPFLGARAYLHGTTLFDSLLAFAPPREPVSFKFSRVIRSDRVRLGTVLDSPSASMTWAGGGIGVIPESPSGQIERRPYDEGLVTDGSLYEDRRIVLRKRGPFSFVATVVPLHKALLQRLAAPAQAGQWMFTRLDVPLAQVPQHWDSVAVVLGSLFQGRLARSTIEVDGAGFGEIYFSWVIL